MSIDTSKIEVGDWVRDSDGGWSRVFNFTDNRVLTQSYEGGATGSIPFKNITAHRPKSGPFKVGDEVYLCGEEKKLRTVESVYCDEVSFTADAWTIVWASDKHCTLHRPVEAIEAERDDNFRRAAEIEDKAGLGQAMREIQPDELLIAELEKRGYRIERIEQPVTLADLPKPCEGEWRFGTEQGEIRGVVFDRWIASGEIAHEARIQFWELYKDDVLGAVLEDMINMSRQLIAEGKLDDAVTARAEVIS